MVKNQFHTIIKHVRFDNGIEFPFIEIQNLFKSEGVIHELVTIHHSRTVYKHQHLLNVARCLCFHANQPLSFWVERVQTAVHIINRTPSMATCLAIVFSNKNLCMIAFMCFVVFATLKH